MSQYSSGTVAVFSGNYTGCGAEGIKCITGATVDARSANAMKGGSNSTSDMVVEEGGIIAADSAFGGTSVTVNTVSADGIIFR